MGYDVRVRLNSFPVGKWVLYFSPRKYIGRSPKWQWNYGGLYVVVQVQSKITVSIQKSMRAERFVVHIKKLKRYEGDAPESWLTTSSDGAGDAGFPEPSS